MPSLDYHQASVSSTTDESEFDAMLSELFHRAVATDRYENNEAIDAIFQAVQDGLLTPEEATDIVLGRMIWR